MLQAVPSGPLCLFLDVDGTLLEIAPRPDGVVVPDMLRSTLSTLDLRLDGALALVSGRSISDLDRLFAPLRLRAGGVHGAELRYDPHGEVEIAPDNLLSSDVVAALRAIGARYPGTLVEDKRFSVAIHFRAVPVHGPALKDDLEAVVHSPVGLGCRILPGHMVFEVKRAGFDKGTALAAFQGRAPFNGRRPVFIGDDVTDLPGFDRVLESGGLAFSVSTPRPGLSGHFPDPQAVRTWLGAVAASP